MRLVLLMEEVVLPAMGKGELVGWVEKKGRLSFQALLVVNI